MPPLSIAVIGAGPAGLATAAFLADAGHRPVLFDRFEKPRPIGAGLLLQPTGLAALRRLGIADEVLRLGSPIRHLHGHAADTGDLVFDFGYDELEPGLHGLGIHRASLFDVLWGAVRQRRIAAETNAEIVDIKPGTDGRVSLIDTRRRAFGPFDLAVCASGARSALRRGVAQARERAFAYGAVWGIAERIGFAAGTLAQRYVTAQVMIGLLPIGRLPGGTQDLVALFWSLKTDTHAAWAADFSDWKREMTMIWPETAPLTAQFRAPGDLTLAAYGQVTLRQPYRGRVAIVGDAAHATSPQLGQGANLALLDAAALADCLEDYADIATALAAYAHQRRAHVRFNQLMSAVLTPFFQSDSRLAAFLRNKTFHRLARVPYLRREMIRTLAGLKTGLFDHSDARTLAGDVKHLLLVPPGWRR